MLPSFPLHGLLSAFDASGANYALGTPDGRVRTYDTVTGRLRSTLASSVEALAAKKGHGLANGNLAEGHTCLTWVDEGVTCLAYSPSRTSLLLSSGRDGQVCVLDTAAGKKQTGLKGSKHAVSAAALSPDGSQLILGGSTLSLWDINSQQRVAKFTGHPLPVRALAMAPSGSFALSAADGERLVAVWPTSRKSNSKKRSNNVAAASLAVEQPVVGLRTLAADGEPPGSFYAAATTEAGEVVVWICRPTAEGELDSSQIARVAVGPLPAGSSSRDDIILAAALEPAPTGVMLLLAAGSHSKPRFVRLQLSSSGSATKLTYVQPSAADGLIKPSAAAAAAGPQQQQQQQPAGVRDVEMLGPDNAGELVQQRVAAAAGSKAGRKRQEPEPDGLAAAAAAAEGEDEEDVQEEGAGEQTLGDRVAQIEQQQQQGAGGPQAAAAGTAAAGAPLSGPLKADSLTVLMSQALRSSDRVLLERCLAVTAESVVNNTVKRLVPVDAALLLRAAVERLQSKPRRGQQLAGWIRALLLHHTAYLMSAPGAAPLMSSLFQIIEARLAMQRQLLSLAGRLDLLLAQSGSQQDAAGATAAAAAAAGPQVEYQESDSEAEVELVDAAGVGEDEDEYEEVEGSDDELEGGLASDEEDTDDDEDDDEGEEEEQAGMDSDE